MDSYLMMRPARISANNLSKWRNSSASLYIHPPEYREFPAGCYLRQNTSFTPEAFRIRTCNSILSFHFLVRKKNQEYSIKLNRRKCHWLKQWYKIPLEIGEYLLRENTPCSSPSYVSHLCTYDYDIIRFRVGKSVAIVYICKM